MNVRKDIFDPSTLLKPNKEPVKCASKIKTTFSSDIGHLQNLVVVVVVAFANKVSPSLKPVLP